MARYDLHDAAFLTPRRTVARITIREDTNDYNTANSALTEDEYGLRDRWLSGLALDIGGHLGTVAIGMALDNPDLRVICVEPVPDNCDLIRRNIEANGLTDRITLVEALAGKSGTGIIRYGFTGSENALHHAFIGNSTITTPDDPHKTKKLPYVSLGELLNGQQATFMKVDCEGGEADFLDTPAVNDVETIVGEWHPPYITREGIVDRLGKTHRVTFSGPEEGPGGFVAERR